MEHSRWFEVENVGEIASPALLIYPHRIEENIRRMVDIAGTPDRIRSHIKTHKMSEILRLQDKFNITSCKCSTIAEAELAATAGVKDILLAVQPVGPNIGRFFDLIQAFPFSSFSAIADSELIIKTISEESKKRDVVTSLWLDINNGMNRTGVAPADEAIHLYKLIDSTPYLTAKGLHVYDGHIHDYLPSERKTTCDAAFLPVKLLEEKLESMGHYVSKIIAGGTPTFPIHIQREAKVETSPGTTVLWDYGYSQAFPDFNFLYAALVLMRIISKPGRDLLCLDLGHKSIASEMPHPRVKIIGLDNYTIRNQSEEHLVIESPDAGNYEVGQHFYGIPFHICPTVARYERAIVVKEGRASGEWAIEARDRKINY